MASPASPPARVVVVGGGIAAVETVLALHGQAGDRVSVTLVAPQAEFALQPLSVTVPFGDGPVATIPLDDILREHDGRFVRDRVQAVHADRRVVALASGTELPYDALVLTPGTRSVPAFELSQAVVGIAFDPRRPTMLTEVTQAIQEGWATSVAFVVPTGTTWPLPLYELALIVADQVGPVEGLTLHFVTPEPVPLNAFGGEASAAVGELLDRAGIAFHGGVAARISAIDTLDIGAPMPLRVDRVVALSRMEGPAIVGVPADVHGFVEIDDECRVRDLDGVWAAGDGTTQPIKQGGLACQQADSVASQIAAAAGAGGVARPPVLVLRARLLAGAEDRYLWRELGQETSEASSEPLWWPPTKVVSRYLAPYVAHKGVLDPAAPRGRD